MRVKGLWIDMLIRCIRRRARPAGNIIETKLRIVHCGIGESSSETNHKSERQGIDTNPFKGSVSRTEGLDNNYCYNERERKKDFEQRHRAYK
jgi:hypothetical protein